LKIHAKFVPNRRAGAFTLPVIVLRDTPLKIALFLGIAIGHD
jgi:hypothetical protein